jgi:hypothetical protein
MRQGIYFGLAKKLVSTCQVLRPVLFRPGNSLVQMFLNACVQYSDKESHETCDTERLMLDNGNTSFRCGTPVKGTFYLYPDGGCEN